MAKETSKRTNGDGSVYFRKSDNRWCAALSLPEGEGEKARRVTRTVPAKGSQRQQEAAAKALLLTLTRERAANGGDIQTAILTVETWARKWLADIIEPHKRPKTSASYRTTVEQYIIPSIGRKQLRKLSTDHVREAVAYVTAKKLSSRSAALTYQVLSLLLKAAYREGKITRNVADLVDRPGTKKPDLDVLTADQAIKVLYSVSGDRLGSRWAAAVFTGARQGELLGLELDRVGEVLDLSWQLQRITWRHGCGLKSTAWPCGKVQGAACPLRKVMAPVDHEMRYLQGGLWLSRPKSTAGWRIVPLVEPLKSIIERRMVVAGREPNPHGLLWTTLDGSPIDPSRDNAAWHRILAQAGFEEMIERNGKQVIDKHIDLHSARHTTVDLLYQAEIPEALIQEIVGHSVVSATRGYRSKGNRKQLQDALTRMSALMIESPLPDRIPEDLDTIDSELSA